MGHGRALLPGTALGRSAPALFGRVVVVRMIWAVLLLAWGSCLLSAPLGVAGATNSSVSNAGVLLRRHSRGLQQQQQDSSSSPSVQQLVVAGANSSSVDKLLAFQASSSSYSIEEELLLVPASEAGGDKQQQGDKVLGGFYAVAEHGQNPHNFQELGGNRFQLTVRPYEEAVRVTSNRWYSSGRFEFRLRTASVMPGVITSVYLASGHGKSSEGGWADQDEIDLEFKGNSPRQVQTNVFIGGKDAAQTTELGLDTSQGETDYVIEWDSRSVRLFANYRLIRRVELWRPLRSMQLHMAVWTTMGGWDGLVKWAGSPDWNGRRGAPASAVFEILSLPN